MDPQRPNLARQKTPEEESLLSTMEQPAAGAAPATSTRAEGALESEAVEPDLSSKEKLTVLGLMKGSQAASPGGVNSSDSTSSWQSSHEHSPRQLRALHFAPQITHR
eukprot:361889-Prymnesium_polylepis.1